MKFNQRDFCHLYGSMWVNIHTCEKMLVIDDLAISLEGLCGRKVFLPQGMVKNYVILKMKLVTI